MLNLAAGFLGLAQMAAGAFGAPYFASRIITQGEAVYDDGGSILVPAAPSYRDCLVQIDALDERNRPEGWSDRDYRFLLLSESFDGAIDTDASIEVTDALADFRGVWSVSALQRDPAGIGWAGKGRRA